MVLWVLLYFSCTNAKTEKQAGAIAVGGYRVYYELSGKGEAIVLLHAGLQDHTMWENQVNDLSKDYKVITLDLPFHGNTTGTDTAILAKDVVKTVLDSLHIDKASVAGLSMGAAVAQDFIIHYPHRVNKAILLSSALYGFEESHPIDSASGAFYPAFLAALQAKDTARAAMVFTKAWGEGIDSKNDSLTKASSRYVYQTTLKTLKKFKAENWPNLQDEPKAFAGITKVSMPVLIIHGDKDLPYIMQTSVYMGDSIPGAKRVLLKGAAHMLNMEQPAEVNRLIRQFLKN